jgi:hypothetical protein
VLFDAQTMVRARPGGAPTPWFQAGDLRLVPAGLMAGAGLPAAAVEFATVTEIGERQLGLLREVAPPGGRVEPRWGHDGYDLRTRDPKESMAWAMRFATRAGQESLPAGTWQLRRRGILSALIDLEGHSAVVSGQTLRQAADMKAPAFAPGVPLGQGGALEVHYFDPLSSAVMVPLFPVALVWMLVDPAGFDRSMNDESSVESPPVLAWEMDQGSAPLFSAAARRRSIVKVEPLIEGAASLRGDWDAGAALGVRFRNFYEFALGVRRVSWAQLAADGGRRVGNLPSFALGVHVDSDADPRFAFYLGAEVAANSAPARMTVATLKWGPRFGWGDRLFITVSPLSVTTMIVTDPGADRSRTTVSTSLELGAAL